jgi:hypothetical protein
MSGIGKEFPGIFSLSRPLEHIIILKCSVLKEKYKQIKVKCTQALTICMSHELVLGMENM